MLAWVRSLFRRGGVVAPAPGWPRPEPESEYRVHRVLVRHGQSERPARSEGSMFDDEKSPDHVERLDWRVNRD